MTRFDDRPFRHAYDVANADVARRSSGYFASDPPNAALSFTAPGDRIPATIVLTLRKPRWNARNHSWRFDATRILEHSDDLPASSPLRLAEVPTPRRFRDATLAIDDAGFSDSYEEPGDHDALPHIPATDPHEIPPPQGDAGVP